MGGSDGDARGAELLLQPQQAVGDALLVAGQAHADLLDVAAGREGGGVME